ncbi:MAG: ATP-dependent protease [Caldilinea sp. CFX5]|nr:ATP-dependent protease [Caldilinea sp. CFX5]
MAKRKALPATALYRACDPDQFDFATTAEVAGIDGVVGQPRALEAVEFGVGIDQEGYNIFALGAVGAGRHSLVRHHFAEKAAGEPTPPDWCYVHNFVQPDQPSVLCVPAGTGRQLRRDMERLVADLRKTLSLAFESEEYQTRQHQIEEELGEPQAAALAHLQKAAREQGLALLRTPEGVAFVPMRDDNVLTPEEIQTLTPAERQRLEAEATKLQDELLKLFHRVPQLQRQVREQTDNLNREVATYAVAGLLDDLTEKYRALPAVTAYLEAVKNEVIASVPDFLAEEEEPEENGADGLPSIGTLRELYSLRRFRVNVLVDHSETHGAPVIYEDNPTHPRLVGRLDYVAQMGVLLTDFNLLKPGALHRANGGYLLLDVRKLLADPFAWETLKRALRAGKIEIEAPGEQFGLFSTVTLEPEPIPLAVKVALVGEPLFYYLLCAYDPEFPQLFKVAADFADDMARDDSNQALYVKLIAGLVQKNKLHPFDRSAVARVIEQSARLAGDADKLSTNIQSLADLLREADYWANKRGKAIVAVADVQQALDAATYRTDRLRERIQEETLRGTLLIDTAGAAIGQINGLSYSELGAFAFGRPSRITARVQMGKGEVINVEREVELSGPIHSKGVLILASFLGARYGLDKPLSLAASLVFEQSYGGVEGDSASAAELFALLSAIAEVPITQTLAVTGSVNQHGRVQAIGGGNEKIEGFFDLCKARGLTGDQGVIIPSANRQHLMLRWDVVHAVAGGKFHIYAIDTVDEGIELLTGIPAGERDTNGQYPEDTINARVEKRLLDLAQKRRAFGEAAKQAS